jgi:UDP-N-acetyl-D-mannosaminuronic acid dehydrogenase
MAMAMPPQELLNQLKRYFMIKFNKDICVIGMGYIGLPTSALLANIGYKVSGVDVNTSVVNTINNGETHFIEPDLDAYVRSSVSSGNLKVFEKPQDSDIYIICVPTPFLSKNDMLLPDLSYIYSAVKSISHLLKDGDTVILESTSPVGTTDNLKSFLKQMGADIDIDLISIAYCPERVLPGNILSELITNDRIVGGINDKSTNIVSEFYETFVEGKVLKTSAKTAEMCKLAENSFRDVNIAYANELSMICDNYNIDTYDLIDLANRHPRVDILQPGTGVGGHCIAVDPWFIVSDNRDQARIIGEARKVNDSKPIWVAEKIIDKTKSLSLSSAKEPKVACFGLAFKPNIDDLRESPAIRVVDILINSGIDVIIVEPNISEHEHYKLVDLEDALQADIIVFLVKHKEFHKLKNESKFMQHCIMDFCGTLN